MVEQTARSGAQPRAKAVPRILHLLAVFAAVLMAGQSVQYACTASGHSTWSTIGVNGQADCDADHFFTVAGVRPGQPADRVGIAAGDVVKFDDARGARRLRSVGERVGLTVRHGEIQRHLDLIAAPYTFYAPTYIIGGLVDVLVCLLALVVLVRAGRGWTGFLLGLTLICHGEPGNYPRLWQNAPSLYLPFLILLTAIWAAVPTVTLSMLRSFRREVIGRSPRWLDAFLAVFAIAGAVALPLGLDAYLSMSPILGLDNGLDLISLVCSAGAIMAPLALATGWQDVPAENRTRYSFMLAAISAFSVEAAVDPIIMLTGNDYVTLSWPVLIQLAALLIGTVLFAYALLRHRVIDLGFAINRTLVFSSLSFVVLLAFGLVEWGTEKLLPFESHEASVVIDAAIALGLFLAFHRIHGWVEHIVERVFFHHWHANEAALADFLRQAAYITDASILAERAVAEFTRFTGGAAAAIYRIDEHGPALRAGGVDGVPARIGIDDPALVAMRANRMLVRDGWVAGDLALPMLHRADVTGLVLIGPRPDGNPYRPDEEAQLSEAARRVGIDLYALRVDELERANLLLTARLKPIAA